MNVKEHYIEDKVVLMDIQLSEKTLKRMEKERKIASILNSIHWLMKNHEKSFIEDIEKVLREKL